MPFGRSRTRGKPPVGNLPALAGGALATLVAGCSSFGGAPPESPSQAAGIDAVVALNQQNMRFGERAVQLGWTADGNSIVVSVPAGTGHGEVVAFDVRTGARRLLGAGETAAPSPTEDRIALIDGRRVQVVDGAGTVRASYRLPGTGRALPGGTADWRSDGGAFALVLEPRMRRGAIESSIVIVENGRPREVRLQAEGFVTEVRWIGDDLLVSSTDAEQTHGRLWRCDARKGTCALLTDEVPIEGFFAFAASPDASRVYFDRDRFRSVFQTAEPAVVDADGGGARVLVEDFPLFKAPWSAWWSADGNAVSFLCQRTALKSHVCTLGFDGSLRTIRLQPTLHSTDAAPSPNGGRLAYVGRGLRDEVQLRVVDVHGRDDRLLAEINPPFTGFAGTATEVTWRGAGGLEMNGILVLPADPRGPVPLLVDLHGGPMGGTKLGSPAVTAGSTAEWWYWASLGYAVFAPNDRRGNLHGAAPYAAMIASGDWTTGPVADVLAGIDSVVARGDIDGGRVGVLGHSAGAVLAYQLHARHGDRFRFVFAKGGFADIGHVASLAAPGTSPCVQHPVDDAECARRVHLNSALPYAGRFATPLMVASGGAEEAEWPRDYVAALRAYGRPVTEHVYADELHTIEHAGNQRDLLAKVTAFVGRAFE